MQKLLFVILIIGFASFILISLNLKKTESGRIITYSLDGKTYTLLAADAPQTWEKGLMFYRKLDGADGMIFVFPDKQHRTFWNKNTYLDLDLVWFDDDKVVGRGFLPSIEKSGKVVTASSPAKVNKVIELRK